MQKPIKVDRWKKYRGQDTLGQLATLCDFCRFVSPFIPCTTMQNFNKRRAALASGLSRDDPPTAAHQRLTPRSDVSPPAPPSTLRCARMILARRTGDGWPGTGGNMPGDWISSAIGLGLCWWRARCCVGRARPNVRCRCAASSPRRPAPASAARLVVTPVSVPRSVWVGRSAWVRRWGPF
jgi:hypothetical protein